MNTPGAPGDELNDLGYLAPPVRRAARPGAPAHDLPMPTLHPGALVALVLAASLVAASAHAQTVWRTATLDDAHTRVQMPGRFQVASFASVTAQGYEVRTHLAEHRSSLGLFGLVVSDQEGGHVSSPPNVADVVTEPVLRQLPSIARRGQRRVSRPGFYADELALEGDDALGLVRRVVGRRRTYLALAVVPMDDLGRARRFVSSLRPDAGDALFEVARGDAPGAWTFVDVPHEHFAVRMPTPSVDRLVRLRLADGGVAQARLVEGRTADAHYRVRSIDRTDAPGLTAAELIARLRLEGEPRSIHAHGHPGVELVGSRGQRVRLFRTRRRWVLFEVESTDATAPGADAFFDSVVLA